MHTSDSRRQRAFLQPLRQCGQRFYAACPIPAYPFRLPLSIAIQASLRIPAITLRIPYECPLNTLRALRVPFERPSNALRMPTNALRIPLECPTNTPPNALRMPYECPTNALRMPYITSRNLQTAYHTSFLNSFGPVPPLFQVPSGPNA